MIRYKKQFEDRLEEEFSKNNMNIRLKRIVKLLAEFVELEFHKDIVITEVFRTQEEQDTYYASNKKYQKKPWASVHQYYRGVDIRTRDFNKKEIKKIISFITHITYKIGRKHKTAIYHSIGYGHHIHLQSV